MIDTHCHLEMDDFDQDREEVIKRAKDAGIEAIITIGSDLEGNIGGLELSKKYDFIYCSVGFHPHDSKDFTEEIYNQIKAWATPPHPPLAKGGSLGDVALSRGKVRGKVIAIGEIGLDYHYDYSPREIQKGVFMKQLQLAKELNLPVIIHSREAKKDTLEIIRQSGINKGVLHCFSGDMDMAEEAMARAISEVRGVTIEDVARITTLNAKRLFKIGQMPEKGVIAYKIRDNLYLNITNRCTNKCSFCIRFHSDYVKGHNLRLTEEPTEEELEH